MQRTEFDLNVTEDPPTSDQLRTILEYVGETRAKDLIDGARSEGDAIRTLSQDPSKFIAPVVCLHRRKAVRICTDIGLRPLTGIMEGPVSLIPDLAKLSRHAHFMYSYRGERV